MPEQSDEISARIDRLRARLEQTTPLRTFDVRVGGTELSITTAADPDALIERISEEEFRIDERLPYWADVWHSAVGLGEHILAHPESVADRDVLEIGCGLGVAGIIAATCGARVTFSDYDADALCAAELNLLVNCPSVRAEFLKWDFRDPPPRTWDVILGSDVMYERRFAEPLSEFLLTALFDSGTALLAEPNRQIAAEFFRLLEKNGFTYQRDMYSVQHSGRTVDVSVSVIQRNARRDGTLPGVVA